MLAHRGNFCLTFNSRSCALMACVCVIKLIYFCDKVSLHYEPEPERSSASRRISLMSKGTLGPSRSSASGAISQTTSYQI